jgi:hypothetical protein
MHEPLQRAAYQGAELRQTRIDPVHGVNPRCGLHDVMQNK